MFGNYDNLLVTILNNDFFEQGKQFFSSIYHNTNWTGSCLVLTNNLDPKKKEWFLNRGIIVKEFTLDGFDDTDLRSKVIFLKFYLFHPFFKKWKKIIYLDSDIIVNNLTFFKEVDLGSYDIGAVSDGGYSNLSSQFFEGYNKKYTFLKEKYNFNRISFNVGVLIINTSIINNNSFLTLKRFYNRFKNIVLMPEQAILNLYFYDKRKKISLLNNLFVNLLLYNKHFQKLDYEIKKNIFKLSNILHFAGHKKNKPWYNNNIFYLERKKNLETSFKISFGNKEKDNKLLDSTCHNEDTINEGKYIRLIKKIYILEKKKSMYKSTKDGFWYRNMIYKN